MMARYISARIRVRKYKFMDTTADTHFMTRRLFDLVEHAYKSEFIKYGEPFKSPRTEECDDCCFRLLLVPEHERTQLAKRIYVCLLCACELQQRNISDHKKSKRHKDMIDFVFRIQCSPPAHSKVDVA